MADVIALRSITPDELASTSAARLLDVRSPGEFETSRLPAAVNIPLNELPGHAASLRADHPDPLVLVCQTGPRAEQAGKLLRERGIDNVVYMHGGMNAWTAEGRDVVRGKQRWSLERQVRLVAGSIVLSSVLASIRVPRVKFVAAGIGGGLTFSALSNTCAMGNLLSRLPYNRPAGTDRAHAVATLNSAAQDRTPDAAVGQLPR